MKVLKALLSIVVLYGWTSVVLAVPFETSFLKLELPQHWSCRLKKGEHLCKDTRARRNNHSLIVISAKRAAPEDNLPSYLRKLKRAIPRQTQYDVGQSQVVQVNQRAVNGHTWVDGLHLGSEIAKYYSRYLITRKDDLALLVNFTVHKDYYKKMLPTVDGIVASLQVKSQAASTDPQAEKTLFPKPGALGKEIAAEGLVQGKARASKATYIMLAAFVGVTLLFFFVVLRRRK